MNWTISIVVGLIFLAFQIVILNRAIAKMQKRCAAWRISCNNLEWKSQTREVAIADLERKLTMIPELGGLRRLGTIAPLLGVVLTASSVLWSQRDDLLNQGNSSGPTSIMTAVIPLFAGVLIGALLAIINQFLVSHAAHAEDRLFQETVDCVSAASFRDSNDRMDAIISELERGGRVLSESSDTIQSMLRNAKDAMHGMNESCSEAATALKGLASRMDGAVDAPVKAFVAAASEMRTGAVAASKDFSAGIKILSRQAVTVEKEVKDALQRQRDSTDQQTELIRQLADAAKAFETCLAPLRTSTLKEFEQSLRGAQASAETMSLAMRNADTQIQSSLSAYASSTEKAAGAFGGAAAEGMETLGKGIEQLLEAIDRAARGLTDARLRTASTAAAAQEAETSMKAFASTLSTEGTELTGVIQKLRSTINDTATEDSRVRDALSATTDALTAMHSNISKLDLSSLRDATSALVGTLRALDADCAASREQTQRESISIAARTSQLEALAPEISRLSRSLDLLLETLVSNENTRTLEAAQSRIGAMP